MEEGMIQKETTYKTMFSHITKEEWKTSDKQSASMAVGHDPLGGCIQSEDSNLVQFNIELKGPCQKE